MNIQDFQIGDYVRIPSLVYYNSEDDYYDGICKITVLSKHEISTDALKDIKLEELEPVLLTPEMLQKINFELYENGPIKTLWTGYGEDNEDDIEVEFDSRDNGIKIKIDIRGYLFRSSEIKYVHELQHIFKLCNIKKEIKL